MTKMKSKRIYLPEEIVFTIEELKKKTGITFNGFVKTAIVRELVVQNLLDLSYIKEKFIQKNDPDRVYLGDIIDD